MAFDEMTFDEMPFNEMPFDEMTYDEMMFIEMIFNETMSHQIIAKTKHSSLLLVTLNCEAKSLQECPQADHGPQVQHGADGQEVPLLGQVQGKKVF